MRVFVAVDISDETKREIEKILKVLEKKHWPVKWEKPEKLHQTLAFLGSIEEDKLNLVKNACQVALEDIKPFVVSFKGLGCFPSFNWPRVIWLGLKGDLHSLAKIYKQLEENLVKAGFVIKKRPFSPHITLGRIRTERLKERNEISRQLKNLRILDLSSQSLIDRLVIYESQLLKTGSVYKKLEAISFL